MVIASTPSNSLPETDRATWARDKAQNEFYSQRKITISEALIQRGLERAWYAVGANGRQLAVSYETLEALLNLTAPQAPSDSIDDYRTQTRKEEETT